MPDDSPYPEFTKISVWCSRCDAERPRRTRHGGRPTCGHRRERQEPLHKGDCVVVYDTAEPPDRLCLGHALTTICTPDVCGHLVAYCHLVGCGRWKPVSERAEILLERVWNYPGWDE